MKYKVTTILIFAFIPLLGFCQQKISNDFLERFQEGDSTVTSYEIIDLLFQYRDVSKVNNNNGLFEELDQLSEDSLFVDLEKRCLDIVESNPLNLNALFYFTISQLRLGKNENIESAWDKTNRVYQAIKRFRDGSQLKPYIVSDLNDAKAFIYLYWESGVKIDKIKGEAIVKIHITNVNGDKEVLYFDFNKQTTTRFVYFDYHRDFQYYLTESVNSESSYHYKTLLKRFKKKDVSLRNHEVIALMIGFTNQKTYKPYINIEVERNIMNLVSDKDYIMALKESKSLLKTNPLNFSGLMEEGYSQMKIKDDKSYFPSVKSKLIVDAIMWSGTGDFMHPYFVLSPIDGQTLSTYIFGYKLGTMGSRSDENGYFLDMLELETKSGETNMFHFNINHAMNNSKLMKEVNKK